jgi:hypothetical protein
MDGRIVVWWDGYTDKWMDGWFKISFRNVISFTQSKMVQDVGGRHLESYEFSSAGETPPYSIPPDSNHMSTLPTCLPVERLSLQWQHTTAHSAVDTGTTPQAEIICLKVISEL